MLKRSIGVSLVTGEFVELIEEIEEPAADLVIDVQPVSRSAILRRVVFGKPSKEIRHAV